MPGVAAPPEPRQGLALPELPLRPQGAGGLALPPETMPGPGLKRLGLKRLGLKLERQRLGPQRLGVKRLGPQRLGVQRQGAGLPCLPRGPAHLEPPPER